MGCIFYGDKGTTRCFKHINDMKANKVIDSSSCSFGKDQGIWDEPQKGAPPDGKSSVFNLEFVINDAPAACMHLLSA
ncbi:hypothetical protein B2I21_03825 [Chryseobacterium mucoviscidosis]|nr:hypothetical protein B2I21_03825 [Chryseobacterium mucoviscidosis]